MPRFVPDGPLVDDRLVQALEDDRVVIFCGAGISMGAGLPSYAGLVEHCYNELGHALPAKESGEWNWPDRMLGMLETRYGTQAVRDKTAERLKREPTDLEMHQAILKLARLRRSDGIRLVTTNFDTFFETADKSLKFGQGFHAGPVVPIPRDDHAASWKSLVYLHGRLQDDWQANTQLVLTSADFGRAYLTDGWAARFVARLFADFTVLFIGYSLNDPVLRYMTDAFAAEDALSRSGAVRGPAYIFLGYEGDTAPDAQVYRERRLEPIFYNQMLDHVRLRETLTAWANAREDYLSNTREIIARIAPNPPESLDPSSIDNLMWAVVGRPADEGHGARIFATLETPPPIQWLFEMERRDEATQAEHKEAVQLSLERAHPTPSLPALHVASLFPTGQRGDSDQPTPQAKALMPWIVAHLDDRQLINWIIEKRRQRRRPHGLLRDRIRRALAENSGLPAGVVAFWRIVSAEGGWATEAPYRSGWWQLNAAVAEHLEDAWMHLEFAAVLRPWLDLRRSFHSAALASATDDEAPTEIEGARLSHYARPDIKLDDEDHVRDVIDAINATPDADAFWAGRLDVLTSLLRQALDFYAVAGEAGPDYDPAVFQRPSIVPHTQNHHHDVWTVYFDLIWQGWQHLDTNDLEASRLQILAWRRIPYATFRRLALAALAQSAAFTPAEKLEGLFNG